MGAEFLSTRLYIPRVRPSLVHRARLLHQLDLGACRGDRLLLVSAAAGSGKTTLLAEWAASCNLRFCWLSVDEDDNAPSRFWAYLIAALQTAHPHLGQSLLPMLQGPQSPPARSILTPLLNELAALSESVVLVLDDYHRVTAGPIHDGVAFLIERLPQRLHLAIATRVDPPLPLARLRARGQLTELRADDLRFTEDEAAEFLNGAMGLGLQPADIAALASRTEGWISGLHLAALSMQGRNDAHAFIKTFTGSHHYVLDYLMEEVLSRQPEVVQHFLLQTSILERLCAPLCDALTGQHDGAGMLERLQRDNLFIIPLDDEQCWYRYHHLFGDLLRKRLGQATPSEQLSELHRRASQWHEGNGLLEQAVKHARAAGDMERVANIAEQAVGDSLLDARLTVLLRWADELPENVLLNHPRLQIYRAWALYMNGHIAAAQQALGDCRRALASLPVSPESKTLRRPLTRLLETIESIARGFMCSLDNRLQQALELCGQARDVALEDGRVLLAVQATEGLALAQYYQGRLRDSARSCRQVIDLATQHVAQAPLAAAGCVELAGIQIEWNDLDGAASLLDEALALCRQWGTVQTLSEAYTARSRLLQARGDVEGARRAIQKAGEAASMEGDRSLIAFRLAVQLARLNLRTGRPEEVVRWAERTKAAFAADERGVQLPAVLLATLETMLARAYLIQDTPQEALETLCALLAPVEAAGAFLHVIEICAIKALALQALGDTSAALALIERSLTLAEPEGYVRMYLDEGPPMARLLGRAASQGIHTPYAASLLAAFAEPTASPSPSSRLPALPELLTPRELEVLHLVSQGCSNRDISDRLVIALNTVKRHTSSIYGKLGVRSRTQAVVRARELGLLPTS